MIGSLPLQKIDFKFESVFHFLFLFFSFARSFGIRSERVSNGKQGVYLHQCVSLVIHGGLWPGQRHFEELAG